MSKSLKCYIKGELLTKSVDNFVEKKKTKVFFTINIVFLLIWLFFNH